MTTTPIAVDDEILVMAEDDRARLLLRERENFGDRYVEVKAWAIPSSDRYPEGIKYSFQYGTQEGETIIRYDNFPDHPDAGHHHRHTSEGVADIGFDGLLTHYQRFKQEVHEHGHDWH